MLDNIGPLTIGAVQHLRNHRCSLSHGWFCSAYALIQDSRSTALKHLRLWVGCVITPSKHLAAALGARASSQPLSSPHPLNRYRTLPWSCATACGLDTPAPHGTPTRPPRTHPPRCSISLW